MTPGRLPEWMSDPDPSALDETIEMTVIARETPADECVALELRPVDGGTVPPWEAGAHVDLHLPGDMVRQYSLCGEPSDHTSLWIAVLREAEGRGGSKYLHDEAMVGDVITVGEPRNNFAFEASARYLFIAGGIGITPLIPMIEQAKVAEADWSLHYGGRSRSTMAFADRLATSDHVTIVPEDEAGLLDLSAAVGEIQDETLIYCCGPEGLISAVEEATDHWPLGALHVERFKPRDAIHDRQDTAFQVVLRRSGLTLTVEPGQTILEAVAAAGVTVVSSCQEGTCGTCETNVLEGIPDHRDSILTPVDQASNEVMMICCSRSLSDCLVLDL